MQVFLIVGIVIIMIAALSINAYFYKKNNTKNFTKEEWNNRIGRVTEQEINSFYDADMNEYMKQLNGKKMIAASCIFHLPDTKEFLKDGAKNFLKRMLTLGIVRFNTVYVPTPLILAEDGLHVLELDTDMDVKNHYILENERLAEAKISSYEDKEGMKQLGDNARFFMLSFPSQNGVKEFELCTEFYPTGEIYTVYPLEKKIVAGAAGRYFLKKLGEHSPNLQVSF